MTLDSIYSFLAYLNTIRLVDFLKLDIDLREYIEKFGLNALAFLYVVILDVYIALSNLVNLFGIC